MADAKPSSTLPKSETLLNLCKDASGASENHTAIEHYYINRGEIQLHTLSYRDLYDIADKVSDVLAQITANRSTLIGLAVTPCTELVVCILAVLKAKCAFVPLEVRARRVVLEKIIGTAKAEFLVSLSGLNKEVQETCAQCGFCLNLLTDIDIGHSMKVLKVYEVVGVSGIKSLHYSNMEEVAYVLTSSGTTGVPKVIAVPHSCIVPNIVHLTEIFNVNRSSIVALMSPPTFDPSIVEMFLALGSRAKLVVPSAEIKMNPSALLDVLFTRAKITILQATPALVMRFSLEDLRSVVFTNDSSLKVMTFGGEQCPSYKMIKNMIHPDDVSSKNLRCSFFNVYGITEVSSWASCHELHIGSILGGDESPVPLGSPLWKTALQIRSEKTGSVLCTIRSQRRDQDLFSCSLDVCGALEEKGQMLSGKLYIGGSERQCYLLGDDDCGEFRDSGDLVNVSFSENKTILHFLGRSDSTVKRNGKKLCLTSLRTKVCAIPGVSACHVTVVESQVITFVVKEISKVQQTFETCNITTSKESKEWTFKCFKTLSENCELEMLPDKIIEINIIPITSHGKVDDFLLKRLLKNIKNSMNLHHSVEDLKELIIILLPNVLSTAAKSLDHGTKDSINWERTFQQHGGDSLAAAIMMNWLDIFLDISIVEKLPNVLDILLQNSLNDFANIIAERLGFFQNEMCAPVNKRKRWSSNSTAVKAERYRNINFSGVLSSFRRGGLCCHFQSYNGENLSQENNRPSGDFLRLCTRLTLELSEQWKYNTGKCIDASPLVVTSDKNEGICYIGSHSHLFAAVSLSDGKEIWRAVLPDRIESSACLIRTDGNDFVVVGCYDGGVYCFEAFSGKLWWKFQTDGEVKSSPCAGGVNNLAYIGSHDGFLYALDVKQMKCQWKAYCEGGAVFSSPAVATLQENSVEVVFVATLGGKLFCFSGKTGETQWKNIIGKPIFSSPLAHSKGVCVGCVDARVYFFNLKGEQVWSFLTGQPIFSSPCLSTKEDSIVIGSHDGCLYNIRILDGSLLWRSANENDPSAIYSTPWPANLKDDSENIIVYASTAGCICIVDQRNGDVLSKKSLPGEIFSSPVVVAEKSFQILVGCRNDNLYCLELTATSRDWALLKLKHHIPYQRPSLGVKTKFLG